MSCVFLHDGQRALLRPGEPRPMSFGHRRLLPPQPGPLARRSVDLVQAVLPCRDRWPATGPLAGHSSQPRLATMPGETSRLVSACIHNKDVARHAVAIAQLDETNAIRPRRATRPAGPTAALIAKHPRWLPPREPHDPVLVPGPFVWHVRYHGGQLARVDASQIPKSASRRARRIQSPWSADRRSRRTYFGFCSKAMASSWLRDELALRWFPGLPAKGQLAAIGRPLQRSGRAAWGPRPVTVNAGGFCRHPSTS
jgi:hypothetical protein